MTTKKSPPPAREHWSTYAPLAGRIRASMLVEQNFPAVQLAVGAGFRVDAEHDLIRPIFDFYQTLTDRVERAQYLVRHRQAIEDVDKALAFLKRTQTPEWLAGTRAAEIAEKQAAAAAAEAKRLDDIAAMKVALVASDEQAREAELQRRATGAVDFPRHGR